MAMTGDETDTKVKRSNRAKSCTACRQAKSKCDLRTRYPASCSRCEKSRQNCQTDASFKRVATRTRIKALEAQVEQLHRSRELDAPSQPSVAASRPEDSSTSAQSDSRANTPLTGNDSAPSDWYTPSRPESPPTFTLHDCQLPWETVNELFLHFATFHLPHCLFLLRITSLAALAKDSPLLLWTIILTAARHHRTHHRLNRALQTAHARLRADTCSEAIQNLPDLQAVLLLCMWPLPVQSQDGDTAGLRLAEALSGARQMGLDMSEHDILNRTLRPAKGLQKFPPRALRLTWLKCFELDVQLSLWHGILPTLAASRYFRSVAEACRSPDVAPSVAQSMDMHVQMARYLLLLDGTSGPESAWNLATSFLQSLGSVKESQPETWAPENELVLDTCQLYICMTSYVHVSRQRQQAALHNDDSPTTTYAKEHLLDAKCKAINIIHHLTALANAAMRADQTPHAGTTPLPGYPKHPSRLMFFAASALLKYLGSEREPASPAQDSARAAFQEALWFFHRCPNATPHVLAGNSLEVAGRAIVQRKVVLQSRVTTRMGASVTHDVRWLSGVLRGREVDKDAEVQQSGVAVPVDGAPLDPDGASGGVSRVPDGEATDQNADWWFQGTELLPAGMEVPEMEMWDDVLDGCFLPNDFMSPDLSQWDYLLR